MYVRNASREREINEFEFKLWFLFHEFPSAIQIEIDIPEKKQDMR